MRWHTCMSMSEVLPTNESYAYGCTHSRKFSRSDTTHCEWGNLKEPIYLICIVLSCMLCA